MPDTMSRTQLHGASVADPAPVTVRRWPDRAVHAIPAGVVHTSQGSRHLPTHSSWPRGSTCPVGGDASGREASFVRGLDCVGPDAVPGVHVYADRPTTCESLRHLLSGRVLIEGVNGHLRLDLNVEWPLLLGMH